MGDGVPQMISPMGGMMSEETVAQRPCRALNDASDQDGLVWQETAQTKGTEPRRVEVTVKRTSTDVKWGLVWNENQHEPGILGIRSIRPKSPIAQYNEKCGEKLAITPGDRVFGINGISSEKGDAMAKNAIFAVMSSELGKSTVAKLCIWKYPPELVVWLEKGSCQSYGLEIDEDNLVTRLNTSGAAFKWNQAGRLNPADGFAEVIHEGMRIQQVCGQDSRDSILKLLQNESEVEIVFRRGISSEKKMEK